MGIYLDRFTDSYSADPRVFIRGFRYSLYLFPQLFPCYAEMGVGYDRNATPQHPPMGPTEVHHGGYEAPDIPLRRRV